MKKKLFKQVKEASHQSSITGFTLIELIMVVVILGVLAVFALPKFAEMGADARRASLDGVVAALHSTSLMVFAEAQVQGVVDGDINYNNTTVEIASGFMYGHGLYALIGAMDIDAVNLQSLNTACSDKLCYYGYRPYITGVTSNVGGRGIIIWVEGKTAEDNCFAYYYNKEDGARPLIGKIDTGC